jgi:hypothetical protein
MWHLFERGHHRKVNYKQHDIGTWTDRHLSLSSHVAISLVPHVPVACLRLPRALVFSSFLLLA